jgi:hypothetical protein
MVIVIILIMSKFGFKDKVLIKLIVGVVIVIIMINNNNNNNNNKIINI